MPLLGVKLNGKHSLNDYGLYLAHREIGFPNVKTDYIDVPGTDGVLDYTVFLTDSVKYGSRDIKLILKAKDQGLFFATILPVLSNDIHGKKISVTFDDDQNHFYIGRAYLEPVAGQKVFGVVNITVTCDPFRYAGTATIAETSGDIVYYGAFTITSSATKNLINPWSEPLTPTVICSSAMSATMNGTTIQLAAGKNTPSGLSLQPGNNEVTFTGNGRVSIDYAADVEGVRVL